VLRAGKLDIPHLCDAVIQAGTLIALIIAPLYFNALTYRTFEPDKAALLRSIALVMVAAWIVKQVAVRPAGSTSRSPSILRLPPVFLPALFLLAATVISTATSILPRVSLWGSYDRGQGLYTFAAYLVLFLFTYKTAQRPEARERIVYTILLTSAPISAYAILQHYGLDILQWQTGGSPTTERAISTLGNPIFLGAYLIMVIPLTLAQLARARERRRTADASGTYAMLLYSVLLVIQALALFFTQSRGPVLGLLGGLGFGGLVWGARQRDRRALLVVGLMIGLLAIGAGLIEMSTSGRTTRLVNLASRTARQRLLAWQGIIELARSDPLRALIGYGPETLREAVSPHLPAELARLIPDQEFDRAHNLILDTWASSGMLGVLAWLVVIGAVVYHGLRGLGTVAEEQRPVFAALAATGTALGVHLPLATGYPVGIGIGVPLGFLGGIGVYLAWHTLRGPVTKAMPRSVSPSGSAPPPRKGVRDIGNSSTSDRHPSLNAPPEVLLAVSVGIVAHVVETLVGIPTTATQTLFWVYAALIAASVMSTSSPIPHRAAEKGRGVITESIWGVLTGLILALLAFSILSGGQSEPGRGTLLWIVLVSTTLASGITMLWIATEDTSPFPDAPRYLMIALGLAVFVVALTRIPLPPFDLTHATVTVFFYILATVVVLGSLLHDGSPTAAAGQRSARWWTLACAVIAVLLLIAVWRSNVNPVRADVYYKHGLIQMQAARWELAVSALRRSLALAPREDRYHAGLGAVYVQLAQRESEAAERERWLRLAEAGLLQAHQLDPYRADHLRNVGLLYRLWADLGPPGDRGSRLRQALGYYDRAVRQNPTSVRTWREWGMVYAALGEWEEAIRRYEESLRLNHGFVETWMLLAEARLHLADYRGALEAYTQAVALDKARVLRERRAAVASSPDNPLPHQALALVYAALGQDQAAMTEADAARDLLGEEPASWVEFLAVLEEASGQ
jgi:tetratricopeptide (TPR) repeat protein/O-antigen ligase